MHELRAYSLLVNNAYFTLLNLLKFRTLLKILAN